MTGLDDLPPLHPNAPKVTIHWVELPEQAWRDFLTEGLAHTFRVRKGLPAACRIVGAAWNTSTATVRLYIDVGRLPFPPGPIDFLPEKLSTSWKTS